MFGIDAPELLVIAAVALIFIGPKELPGMLRSIGKWVATARNMAGEFRGHVDDMMRQADLDELKKQVEAGAKDAVLDLQGLDPTREIKAAIEEGATDAEKELAAARTAVDTSTADALPAPPVDPAEFVAEAGATASLPPPDVPTPTVESDMVAAPSPHEVVISEQAPDVAQVAPANAEPAVPAAANEPAREAPQKIAVG